MSTFYPHANLRQGLVGAWCPSLGYTGRSLIDRTGLNAAGAVSLVTPTTWVPDGSGLALRTTATDSSNSGSVTAPARAITGARASLSIWVRRSSSLPPGNINTTGFFETDGGASATHYPYSDGQCYFRLLRSARTQFTPLSSVNRTQWHHLCVVTNGTNYSVFQAGLLAYQTTAEASVSVGPSILIGRSGSSYFFDGWLDDIRLYNRAITLPEIRLLASSRGIGLRSVRKRYTLNYPIVNPPNRLYAKASGLWVPGTPKVNKNGFWASYTPTTATYHADAVDWETRVRANGGTVSVETLQAVSNFCTEIATAGIRSKLYRVNLFCGNNLQACLVPLYTSPTTGSAPVGGYAVDFNTGFLNSDYMEKGIGTGGLRGNGVAAKKLSTNLRPQDVTANSATGHFGMYIPPWRPLGPTFAAVETPVVSLNNNNDRAYFDWRVTGGVSVFAARYGSVGTDTTGISNPSGLMIGDRSSTTRIDMYRQGVSVSNRTVTNGTMLPLPPFEIFSNQLSNYTSNPLFGYTLGSSLTATEHVAYSAAWNTFQAALSRGV